MQVFKFFVDPFWWDHWSIPSILERLVHFHAGFVRYVSVSREACFGKAFHLKVWACSIWLYCSSFSRGKAFWLPLSVFRDCSSLQFSFCHQTAFHFARMLTRKADCTLLSSRIWNWEHSLSKLLVLTNMKGTLSLWGRSH